MYDQHHIAQELLLTTCDLENKVFLLERILQRCPCLENSLSVGAIRLHTAINTLISKSANYGGFQPDFLLCRQYIDLLWELLISCSAQDMSKWEKSQIMLWQTCVDKLEELSSLCTLLKDSADENWQL
jgi:hypothetical protein